MADLAQVHADLLLEHFQIVLSCLRLKIFSSLSSGHLIHNEMGTSGYLLSNMSILLIKSMLSCCVQNGGPNKVNQ